MKKALTLRVEIHENPEKAPRVAIWHILPEHIISNVMGAANRCECLVKTFTTVDGDDVSANRVPYFDYDGMMRVRDPQAWIEYDGVRHFEQGAQA